MALSFVPDLPTSVDPFLDMAEVNVQRLKHLPRTNHDLLADSQAAVDNDPVRLQLAYESSLQSLALIKALRLATSLEVAVALLRGEQVPRSALNPQWLKAYGL